MSALLDELLELGGDARARRLDAVAARDASLAAELRELLAREDAVLRLGFLEGRAADPGDATLAGRKVGGYTIERLLGHGGMGTVWLARRSDGRFEARVAVKFLNAALLGGGGAERFRREGSILARLSHPRIARILDAGIADGQPYLVLEHVEGETIDRWCDAHALGCDARVALFLSVLDAVAHAHANLILHRDLKPSNVLVTSAGEVKLLDFGVAKLLDDPTSPAGATALTEAGGRALTPEYASPEQLRGEPLTVASDVYSLGLVLHRLLAGALPRRPGGAGAGPHASAPPAPSASVSDPDLRRRLRGDLDAIVRRALAPAVPDRYPTVAALADDLERHLGGRPIRARPDRALYRARKFVLRNRAAVAAASGALLAVVAAGAIAAGQARVATRERDRALVQLERAQAAATFVQTLIEEAARADEKLTIDEVLERGERLAEGQLAGRPEQQAAVLNSLATYYVSLASYPRAEALLARAADLVRGSADASLRAYVECNLALARAATGDAPAARVEEALRAIAAWVARPDLEPDAAITCEMYASQIGFQTNDAAVALSHAQGAQALLARLGRPMPALEAEVDAELGAGFHLSGRNDEADRHYARAVRRYREQGREDGPAAIAVLNNWGLASYGAGDVKRALEVNEEVIRLASHRAKDPPPYATNNRASALFAVGRFREALAEADRAARIAREVKETPFEVSALATKAGALAELGELAGAERVLEEAAARGRDLPADGFSRVGLALRRSRLHLLRGRADLARDAIAPTVELLERRGARSATLARVLLARAESLRRLGDGAAAAKDARAALELARALQGGKPTSLYAGQASLLLARLRADAGDRPGAAEAARIAATDLADMLGDEHPDTRAARALAAP